MHLWCTLKKIVEQLMKTFRVVFSTLKSVHCTLHWQLITYNFCYNMMTGAVRLSRDDSFNLDKRHHMPCYWYLLFIYLSRHLHQETAKELFGLKSQAATFTT